MRERRKKMETENKKQMFLRKEKTALAVIKQKKLQKKKESDVSSHK